VNLNSGCSAVIGQPGTGVVLPQVARGEVHLCVCDRAKRIVNRRELMQSLLLSRQLLAEILAVDCLWGVLVSRARERAAEKGLLVPASSTGSQHKKNTHQSPSAENESNSGADSEVNERFLLSWSRQAVGHRFWHQNLSSAGKRCDMEGNIGENEERVAVLGKLLQSRHVVRTRERQVDQEAWSVGD